MSIKETGVIGLRVGNLSAELFVNGLQRRGELFRRWYGGVGDGDGEVGVEAVVGKEWGLLRRGVF